MAVPSAVTVDQIVTEALKRAGRTTPSSAVIASAKTHQFREVKSDFEKLYDITLPEMYGEQAGITIVGETTLAMPTSTIHKVESVRLYDPDQDTDGWTGTLQAGTSTTMTLAADLDEDAEDLQGRHVYFTGGTGSGQLVQLSNWNNSTKVAQITGTFETTPSTDTTYEIARDREYVCQEDLIQDTERDTALVRGIPTKWSSIWANPGPASDQDDVVRAIRWNRVPDKTYPVKYVVQYALDHLDETGTRLKNLLRDYRSIWIQGVAAYSMQLYDEDRFLLTYQIYQEKLQQLASKNTRIYLMNYYGP